MTASQIHGRAIVCSDVTNADIPIPDTLKRLLKTAVVSSVEDALSVALHVMTLEYGFFPLGISQSDSKQTMPPDWKKPSCYRAKYYHPSCPEQVCVWDAVPMGCLLIIHGHLESDSASSISGKCSIRVDVHRYVLKQECDVTAEEQETFQYSYCDLPSLSRHFKDGILYILLTTAQQNSNTPPTFGLVALCPELKLNILEMLDVHSLISMSEVNSEFHSLADTQSLWKRLCLQDFGTDERFQRVNHILENGDWKRHYKWFYRLRRVGEQHIIRSLPPPLGVYPLRYPDLHLYPRVDERFPRTFEDIFYWPGRRPPHSVWPPFPTYF